MHLCDLTMFYAPHSGGVRRYLDAKHDWLARHTLVRHTLLTPGPYRGLLAPHQHTLCAPPLPFSDGYRFPLRTRPWVKYLLELSPDLIEAGDPYRLGWAALEAGQRLGIPTIGFYHSDLPRLIAARFGNWTQAVTRRYVRHLYRRYDQVLTPSQVMRDQLLEFGVDNVQVQPLGVDAERFHPRRHSEHLRRELGLPRKSRLLIFAGRNAREKHIDRLVEAFRLLGPDYHLLLVGPEMPCPSVSNISAFARYVGAAELSRLLAGSDALVHAGDTETFGLIVLEAMASGIPVVGVNAGAVPELVTPETGVLSPSCAARDLADAVIALFEQDVAAMGHAARQAVEAHWTWDRTLARLFDIYLDLLGQPPAGTGTARAAG
ncbi:MAG: glycosyltransferase family 1 protein [Gammaproteobacteria bacterium]